MNPVAHCHSLRLALLLTFLCALLTSAAHAGLSQTAFPAGGGTLTISTSSPGPYYVEDAIYFFLLDANGNSVSSSTYPGYWTGWQGGLQVPSNSSQTQAITYTVVLYAHYYNPNNGVGGDSIIPQGSITVAADNIAPTISNIAFSATAFPAGGGTLSVSADVTDANVGFFPSNSFFELVDSAGNEVSNSNVESNDTTWYGYLQVPSNASQTQAATYTVRLYLFDSVHNTWDMALGSITVAADNIAPTISSIVFSATTFPAGGGTLSVSADVTDANVGLLSEYSNIVLVDASGSVVSSSYNSISSGSLTVPSNASQTQAATYTVRFIIYDSVGNYWYPILGTITVAPDLHPTSLTAATVSGTAGQTVTLMGVLTSNGAAVSGKTVIFQVDGQVIGTAKTQSSGTARLSYVIPNTATVGSHALSGVFAGDSASNTSSVSGTLTVN